MHPDDVVPPLPTLLGNDRIMHCVEGFERLVALASSPSNKIACCQGSFAEMSVDVPATIRQLGPQMIGEDDGEPGDTMLGRLYAFGYIRGLLDATER
jgi:mannonate dehydratase